MEIDLAIGIAYPAKASMARDHFQAAGDAVELS